MKRLIVYFHYDPLGQIDTACRVAVEAMAHYGEVFFISNGTLRPADRAWAASVTLTCRERENKGLDVGAYKEALAVIGRGRLARYDELHAGRPRLLAGLDVRCHGGPPGAGLLGLDPPLRHEEPTLWRPQRGSAGTSAIPLFGRPRTAFAQRGFLAVLAENAAAQKL